jgi:hypothetical protein
MNYKNKLTKEEKKLYLSDNSITKLGIDKQFTSEDFYVNITEDDPEAVERVKNEPEINLDSGIYKKKMDSYIHSRPTITINTDFAAEKKYILTKNQIIEIFTLKHTYIGVEDNVITVNPIHFISAVKKNSIFIDTELYKTDLLQTLDKGLYYLENLGWTPVYFDNKTDSMKFCLQDESICLCVHYTRLASISLLVNNVSNNSETTNSRATILNNNKSISPNPLSNFDIIIFICTDKIEHYCYIQNNLFITNI